MSRILNPYNLLGEILDCEPDDVVVLSINKFSEGRAMQTADEKVKFRQSREEDGDWLLIEFLEPRIKDWWEIQERAFLMGLATPFIMWSGPVNNIPDNILTSDAPLSVRIVDRPGWYSLRYEAGKLAKVTA